MKNWLEKIKKAILQAPVYRIIRYSYVFTMVLILVVLTILFYFLYNNFYQTLAQTKEVQILRQQVPLESMNNNLYEQVAGRLREKASRATITTTSSNPFLPPPPTASNKTKP